MHGSVTVPEVQINFKEPKQPKEIPARVRKAVKQRSNGRCEKPIDGRCTGRASDMHHISRRAQGRDHSPDNLLHLCHSDHMYVHAHVAWAKANGYLASSFDGEQP